MARIIAEKGVVRYTQASCLFILVGQVIGRAEPVQSGDMADAPSHTEAYCTNNPAALPLASDGASDGFVPTKKTIAALIVDTRSKANPVMLDFLGGHVSALAVPSRLFRRCRPFRAARATELYRGRTAGA